MKIIEDRSVKEMMMMNQKKKKKHLMKFVCGKMDLRSVTMNQSLMWRGQIVNSGIKWLWSMCVVFVGFFNTITKAALLGNGIFHIIMHLLHLIFSTYRPYLQNLRKEQNQYVFFPFVNYLDIYLCYYLITVSSIRATYECLPSSK